MLKNIHRKTLRKIKSNCSGELLGIIFRGWQNDTWQSKYLYLTQKKKH